MKKILSLALSLTIYGSTCFATDSVMTPQQRVNDQAVLALIWMQRSAEYKALSHQAYNALIDTVKNAEDDFHKKPMAIILDIDETVLDNTPYKARSVGTNIGKARGAFHKWVEEERAEVLPGAAKALQFADKHGVELFYVSGRSAKNDIPFTMKNLKAKGVPVRDESRLLFQKDSSSKASRFAEVEKKYDVIAYVGDNLLDFPFASTSMNEATRNFLVSKNYKKFGKKFIMLPNPDYGSWEYVLADNYRKLSPEEVLNIRYSALLK